MAREDFTKEELDKWEKQAWGNPSEENQWLVNYPMSEWVTGEPFEGQPTENAVVYVRESPPPAKAKAWRNNGESFELGSEYDDPIESFDPNGPQPFLFSSFMKAPEYSSYGKLDDKAKTMLKEKFNVDVDA